MHPSPSLNDTLLEVLKIIVLFRNTTILHRALATKGETTGHNEVTLSSEPGPPLGSLGSHESGPRGYGCRAGQMPQFHTADLRWGFLQVTESVDSRGPLYLPESVLRECEVIV